MEPVDQQSTVVNVAGTITQPINPHQVTGLCFHVGYDKDGLAVGLRFIEQMNYISAFYQTAMVTNWQPNGIGIDQRWK